MKGKRGQGLGIEAFIIVILAVVVGASLIWWFVFGGNEAYASISPFSGSVNIDSVRTSCKSLCDTTSKDSFCGDTTKSMRFLVANKKYSVKDSCYALSQIYPEYEIANCPAFNNCDNRGIDITLYANETSAGATCATDSSTDTDVRRVGTKLSYSLKACGNLPKSSATPESLEVN